MSVEIVNEQNFDEKVTKSDKPVIIDFHADWCMPCKMMAPVLEELSEDIKEATFAKVDTESNPNLSSQFSIHGIPCLVITKEGKEVDRIVGFAPKQELKEKINKLFKDYNL